ncbi:MAG: PAS domain-containing protein [Burkholderiaceae bacterium]
MSQTTANISAQLSESIFKSIHEAIIYADLKGIIQYWNHGSETVFGFSAAEAVGQSLDLIIPEKLRKAHWDGWEKAIARGDTISGRGSRITRAVHKTGQTLYVDMSFAMVRDQSNELIGSLAVARDATERYQEERKLRQQVAGMAPNA